MWKRNLPQTIGAKMNRNFRKQLEQRLSAISHAARGIQIVTSVAAGFHQGKAADLRLREAELNFQEAARLITLAMGKGAEK
jgi:hypothetical protein